MNKQDSKHIIKVDENAYTFGAENLVKTENINVQIFNSGSLTKEGEEYLKKQEEQQKIFQDWTDKGIKFYF